MPERILTYPVYGEQAHLKSKLIQAFIVLTSKQGYHETTLKSVGEQLKLSKTGVTWHYKTKDRFAFKALECWVNYYSGYLFSCVNTPAVLTQTDCQRFMDRLHKVLLSPPNQLLPDSFPTMLYPALSTSHTLIQTYWERWETAFAHMLQYCCPHSDVNTLAKQQLSRCVGACILSRQQATNTYLTQFVDELTVLCSTPTTLNEGEKR